MGNYFAMLNVTTREEVSRKFLGVLERLGPGCFGSGGFYDPTSQHKKDWWVKCRLPPPQIRGCHESILRETKMKFVKYRLSQGGDQSPVCPVPLCQSVLLLLLPFDRHLHLEFSIL